MKIRNRRAFRARQTLLPVLLIPALAIGACSSEPSKKPPDPQFAVIGYTKAKLIACAGNPVTRTEAGGLEYLVYHAEIVQNEGYFQGVPRIPGVGSLATGSKGDKFACEATFALRDGSVTAATFRIDPPQDSKTASAICAPIVAHCTSQ
jgi:hypothetical protein